MAELELKSVLTEQTEIAMKLFNKKDQKAIRS